MRHRLLKITSFLLLLIITFSLLPNAIVFSSGAADRDATTAVADQKVYSAATIEDDFADNALLIVLSKRETRKFKTYTKNDFEGINIAKVDNLTASTAETVKTKLEASTAMSQSADNSMGKTLPIIDVSGITDDANNNSTNDVSSLEKMTDEKVESFRSILYIELADKGKEKVLAAIKRLESNEDFLYVGPDYRVGMCATPNDEKYSEQWGLPKIHAPVAWDTRTTVATSVHVGVVDTGIQANHPDLVNRIYSSKHRDFTTGDTAGTVINVDSLVDPKGHGTHVAGIIGAQGNNYIGGTGVCWDIKLISLRVLGSNGYGQSSYIISAINYAQTANIDILNMSLGSTAYDAAMETAIRNYTGLIVAAAGNNDKNTDTTRFYPASFTATIDNVISVGASDSNDERSNWNGFLNLWGLFGSSKSNYGKTTVDVFAPGTDIYSTLRNGNYGKMSGTSMATPYVTGVAALMMSIRQSLNPSDIKHMINYTTDQKTSLTDLCVSGGRLNAAKAVEAASNTLKLSVPASARYTERVMTISSDVGYKDFIVSFTIGGNRVIQTFGANTMSHDGYLEVYNMEGTRLAYNDDDGYKRNALISFNFQSNVSYRIRVRFYNTSTQSGDIRLAIVPTYSYDNYDAIYSLTNYTMGLTWSFSQNNVKIMTYTYTTSRDLTMRVTSEVDTFLYIIDPSSPVACYQVREDDDESVTSSYKSLCNDDYIDEEGEYVFNSRLRKYFEAEIPYLIIVSAYNPSLPESVGSFYVDFE